MEQDVQEGYRLLDHVTDALIEAWGSTFERALAQAAIGLVDTMVDSKTVRQVLEEVLVVEGHDELELVYNWLEQVLLSFEIKQQVFADFQVDPVKSTGDSIRVRAKARGEKYNPRIHEAKVEVKGITYHLMEIRREPRRVTVRYLLDL